MLSVLGLDPGTQNHPQPRRETARGEQGAREQSGRLWVCWFYDYGAQEGSRAR